MDGLSFSTYRVWFEYRLEDIRFDGYLQVLAIDEDDAIGKAKSKFAFLYPSIDLTTLELLRVQLLTGR